MHSCMRNAGGTIAELLLSCLSHRMSFLDTAFSDTECLFMYEVLRIVCAYRSHTVISDDGCLKRRKGMTRRGRENKKQRGIFFSIVIKQITLRHYLEMEVIRKRT